MYQIIILLFSLGLIQTADSSLINPKDFKIKLEALENEYLIDVRTSTEFKQGHLLYAINVDWFAKDFDSQIAILDKNRPVFVYCKIGGRSSEAAKSLRKIGFKTVYDLKGGVLAWEKENFEIQK